MIARIRQWSKKNLDMFYIRDIEIHRIKARIIFTRWDVVVSRAFLGIEFVDEDGLVVRVMTPAGMIMFAAEEES